MATKIKKKHWRWFIVCYVTALFVIAMLNSCSPVAQARRSERIIDRHERKLDMLQKMYPELFNHGRDTTIIQKSFELIGKIKIVKDTAALDSLDKELTKYIHKADSVEQELKYRGVNDCDTVIKYLKGATKTVEKKVKVYERAIIYHEPIRLDSNGAHIYAYSDGSGLHIKATFEEQHIIRRPELKEKERSWFWWFVVSVAINAFLIFGILKWRH